MNSGRLKSRPYKIIRTWGWGYNLEDGSKNFHRLLYTSPFPKSIFDNVAYGPRLLGVKKKGAFDEIVERSLRGPALQETADYIAGRFG